MRRNSKESGQNLSKKKIQRKKELAEKHSHLAMRRVLKIFAVLNLIFILFSLTAADINLPFFEGRLVFKPFEKLFEFAPVVENTVADSLISGYIAKEQGGITKNPVVPNLPSTGNAFTNPVNNGIYALDNFFRAFTNDGERVSIHIAHYGDSQLEGDRITSDLRNKLQAHFGGTGYGYIPLTDIATPVSYERNSSANWIKYNVFSKKLVTGENYGLSGSAFKFAYSVEEDVVPESGDTGNDIENDTVLQTVIPSEKTLKHFTAGDVSYRFNRNRNFAKAFLLFGKVKSNVSLKISADDNEVIYDGNLFLSETYRENNLNKLDIPVSAIQKKINIHISGDNTTEFYGLYLDGVNKIQVDNYSIRGHSGNGIALLNENFVKLQLQYIDTRLIIMQFGGNTVPYVLNLQQKDNIEKMYSGIIEKFRKLMPEASILIVGVGDMAKSSDGVYKTYPGLVFVRDALKAVAVKWNCAFWDLYESMGGENSILKWADKGLAAKDGHFSAGGERIVANELASHIIREYENYKKRNDLK